MVDSNFWLAGISSKVLRRERIINSLDVGLKVDITVLIELDLAT